MTRFDDVARLRELEKKAEPAPWAIKTPEHSITIKDKNGTEKSKPIPNGIILRWIDDEELA